nr:hypothetical protein [Nonlabens ulvanivorans]
MTELKNINNTISKEWLDSISELLSNENTQSTRTISNLVGIENPKYKRAERISKFLIPRNKNLNLKLEYLTDLFPKVELRDTTYDGGIQLFFYPMDN